MCGLMITTKSGAVTRDMSKVLTSQNGPVRIVVWHGNSARWLGELATRRNEFLSNSVISVLSFILGDISADALDVDSVCRTLVFSILWKTSLGPALCRAQSET